MNDDDIRDRIDDLLDQRRDPLLDDGVLAALAADPARLDEFATERALLDALAASRFRRPRRVWPSARSAAGLTAAGLLIAGLLVARLVFDRQPADDQPQRQASVADAPRPPRILSVQFDERPPTLQTSVSYRVCESLVETPSTTFEIYADRTETR